MLIKKYLRFILISIYLFSLGLSLLSALFLPIYVDEVQWKITVSRFFLDSGNLLYLFPACSSGWLLPTPISWYPGRILDGFLYGDASSPAKLRIYGWSIFIALIFLWTWMLHKLSRLTKFNSFLLVTSFYSIGMLPYLMVLNRPEQSLLVWLSLALVISIGICSTINFNFLYRFLILSIFMLVGALMGSAHPKGIFFFPLLLIIYTGIERSNFFRLTYLAELGFVAYETITLWKLRTICEESPWLMKLINQFTLQPQLLMHDPLAFLSLGIENLKRINEYFLPLGFYAEYPSQWFLSTPLVKQAPELFLIIGYVLPVIILVIILALSIRLNHRITSFDVLKNKIFKRSLIIHWSPPILAAIFLVYVNRWPWALVVITYSISPMYSGSWALPSWKNIRPSSFGISPIMLGILLTVFILSFMQTLKNFYEASLIWPLALLFFIFSTKFITLVKRKIILNYILPGMLFFGIIYALLRAVLAYDLPVMKFNMSNIDSNKVKIFAKNTCNISQTSYPLIVDDQTYSVFWERPNPLHVSYVFGWWSTGTSPSQTIKKRAVQGLIIYSHSLSPEITKKFICNDGLCCMSKSALELYRP